MINFVIGVCVGYFCRPAVAIVINFITDTWKKYQSSKSNNSQ
ncbi:hypothetical protein Ga0466249_005269 [Sporomusaceae bacterium BoRhaA]|nr:hypothetical protein [Pelorhabdus rhamnosifermentans]